MLSRAYLTKEMIAENRSKALQTAFISFEVLGYGEGAMRVSERGPYKWDRFQLLARYKSYWPKLATKMTIPLGCIKSLTELQTRGDEKIPENATAWGRIFHLHPASKVVQISTYDNSYFYLDCSLDDFNEKLQRILSSVV